MELYSRVLEIAALLGLFSLGLEKNITPGLSPDNTQKVPGLPLAFCEGKKADHHRGISLSAPLKVNPVI